MPISRFVYDPWELPAEQRQTTFVGRGRFLDRFLGAIREQEGRATVQHYILTGPRGIGKTTLLLVLRDRIRQDPEISAKWFCVQLREEEYYVHKQRDLWQLVLQALAVEEKLAEAQKVVDQAQEIRDEEKSSALLVDGLRSICNCHGKRLVLLIDNFDHIFPNTAAGEAKHRKPDSEYRAFRKRLSTEGFLMLIATSVKIFEDIYGYDKGFFHFFSPVELPELSREEVAEMLRRLGQADDNAEFLSRLERSKVNVQTLSVLTGGNPRLITMLYHILAQREISEPVQALWETVAGLTPMLRQELADMPRQQSKTLDALLRLNGAAAPAEISKYSRLPLNVVTTQLGRLKAARYVALEGGGKGRKAIYRVADQMFGVWYSMRYVPVARRRIELFTDFLRVWFSLEERRRLYQERLERFHAYQSRGFVGLAGQTLRNAEYLAASFDDPAELKREMEWIADAYVTTGDMSSAAGLDAELAGTKVKSMAKFESLGYSVLANRLVAKGDVERALKIYSEALAKDPRNAETRAHFGITLFLSERHAEATEQFGQILKRTRLKAELRAIVLIGRGIARAHLGDPEGAMADYTAVLELPGAPAALLAKALVNRASIKRQQGDAKGEIADYTSVVGLQGAPADLLAKALVNRGVARGILGDPQAAMVDYTAAVELKGAPVEVVAEALVNRGLTKGQLGLLEGEIADCTAAVELKGAPAEVVVRALFISGATRGQMGHPQGEIADYTAVVDLQGASAEQVAKALVKRAAIKGQLGDHRGVIADCTAAVELKGAPATQTAKALANRGVAKYRMGDLEGAVADCSTVVEMKGTPAEQVADALFTRGVTKGKLGDSRGAIADYNAVVDLEGASAEQAASALVNRGVTKGQLGDPQGEMADYTSVVELQDAPAEMVGRALIARAVAKGNAGDPQSAIADCTALVQMKDAPAEFVASALVLRGLVHVGLGQHDQALKDFNLSLENPKLREEFRTQTILDRGMSQERLGEHEEALADYTRCAQSGILPYVHDGLQAAVRLLLSEKRVDEALAWVRRFHELEPSDVPLESRLEARLDVIRAASGVASLDDTSRLVDALLETDPEELRARLQFLKPGLELAKTHDESVMAKLPEDERKIAKEIARSLAEAARPPMGQPPS